MNSAVFMVPELENSFPPGIMGKRENLSTACGSQGSSYPLLQGKVSFLATLLGLKNENNVSKLLNPPVWTTGSTPTLKQASPIRDLFSHEGNSLLKEGALPNQAGEIICTTLNVCPGTFIGATNQTTDEALISPGESACLKKFREALATRAKARETSRFISGSPQSKIASLSSEQAQNYLKPLERLKSELTPAPHEVRRLHQGWDQTMERAFLDPQEGMTDKERRCTPELIAPRAAARIEGDSANSGKLNLPLGNLIDDRAPSHPELRSLLGHTAISAHSPFASPGAIGLRPVLSQEAAALNGSSGKTTIPKGVTGEQTIETQILRAVFEKVGNGENGFLDANRTSAGTDHGNDSLWMSQNNVTEKVPEGELQTRGNETFRQSLGTEVLAQIVEKAVFTLRNGQTSLRIRLKPDILGPLRMVITTENHQVMVKILTEVPWVKETIENNLDQLRSALQNHGLEIDRFDVSVGADIHQQVGGEKTYFSPPSGDGADGLESVAELPDGGESEDQFSASSTDLGVIDFFI